MKILHVYDEHERVFPGEGSGPSIVYNLAKRVAAMGHEVTILERRWKGLKSKEKLDGINFIRIKLHFCSSISRKEPPQVLIRKPIGLLRFIADRTEFAIKTLIHLTKNPYDIIVLHFPFAAVILVALAKKLRPRMIYTEWIVPFPFGRISPDLYIMKRVGMTIVEHRNIYHKLVHDYKISRDKVIYIPTCVDTEEFYPQNDENVLSFLRREFKNKYKINISKEEIFLLYVGPFTPRKGLETLVKAVNILVNELGHKEILLLIKATMVEKNLDYILSLIIQSKLTENVRVITEHISNDEMKNLYHITDICIAPFLKDGSTSVLEPLACGKPLVGAEIEELFPMIIDGWNGLLFKPGDEKDLAKKIEYLIKHPPERKRMGQNSRKLAEEEFDCRKVAEKYLSVYRKLLMN